MAKVPDIKPMKEQKTVWGIASFVCGLVAVITGLFGIILGILAIVFYFKQQKDGPTGLATAGLVLGIFGIVLWVVIVGIGAIAYFGVLAPTKFLPDKCSASPPFACTEYRVTPESVDFTLQNLAGTDLEVTEMTASCDAAPRQVDFPSGTVLNGDSIPVQIPGCKPDDSSRVRMLFTLEYLKPGETTPHVSSGSVYARVEG